MKMHSLNKPTDSNSHLKKKKSYAKDMSKWLTDSVTVWKEI